MEEHDILPYTYPLTSLDTSTLKKLATSPARFSLMLRRQTRIRPSRMGETLGSTRLLLGVDKPRKVLGKFEGNKIHGFVLFPGGRFLFILREVKLDYVGNQSRKTCAQLWDLGIPGSPDHMEPTITRMLSGSYFRWDICPNATHMIFDLVAISQDDRWAFDTLT